MTVTMTVHWSFAVGVMDSRDARGPRSSTTSRPGHVIDVSVFTLAGKLIAFFKTIITHKRCDF